MYALVCQKIWLHNDLDDKILIKVEGGGVRAYKNNSDSLSICVLLIIIMK